MDMMALEQLDTIQKRNNLNEVYRAGAKGPGGAHHLYVIGRGADSRGEVCEVARVRFQEGPRNEADSRVGVLGSDLLEIVRDTLKEFQAGPYACRENACALTHIEEALMWLNRRAEDRAARDVLGKNEK